LNLISLSVSPNGYRYAPRCIIRIIIQDIITMWLSSVRINFIARYCLIGEDYTVQFGRFQVVFLKKLQLSLCRIMKAFNGESGTFRIQAGLLESNPEQSPDGIGVDAAATHPFPESGLI